MTEGERIEKLNKILGLLQNSGYIYDKSKGGVNGETQMPPQPGTRMNCQSAARIFMQLAVDMGIEGLEACYFASKGEFGYFVPTTPSVQRALGSLPEINSLVFKGWELDNHYRVKDTVTGRIYDPTFGTSSGQNPIGIIGTSMTYGLNFEMTTEYGEKYRVIRQGVRVECIEISKSSANQKHLINDTNFTAKQITLR